VGAVVRAIKKVCCDYRCGSLASSHNHCLRGVKHWPRFGWRYPDQQVPSFVITRQSVARFELTYAAWLYIYLGLPRSYIVCTCLWRGAGSSAGHVQVSQQRL
jgi:hypothetical protein